MSPRVSARHFTSKKTIKQEVWEFICDALSAAHAVSHPQSRSAPAISSSSLKKADVSPQSAGRASLDVPEAAHLCLIMHATLFGDQIMAAPRELFLSLLKTVHLASRKRVQRLGSAAALAVLRVVSHHLSRSHRAGTDIAASDVFEWFLCSAFQSMQQVRNG